MVEKSIEIGFDCIIAWDVLITESDWHNINGIVRTLPVYIGDNVWVTHGVSITKGATIPSGCIVGAKSLVTKNGVFREKSLIVGTLLKNEKQILSGADKKYLIIVVISI